MLENKIEYFSEALQHPIFSAIKCISDEHQLNAFVIGGYVRDLLLARPCKDIDIVVEGNGLDLAKLTAQKLNIDHVNYFKNFGTANFKLHDFEVEFVGARKESYRRDSRKPIVEEGSIIEDQNRRDFTINAMALSLNSSNFGELADPFNGLKDLEKNILRTPLNPDITFSDDPLRMMRGIRFATQLNFKLDAEALKAIEKNKDRITIISQERITDEINKIMLTEKPSVGFKLLFNTGLLDIIFPELTALYGVEIIDGLGHKDNFYHTLQVLDNICQNTNYLWLRWAALLHDIAKPQTKFFTKSTGWTFHGHEDRGAKMVPKIFRRLKLPLDNKMRYVQKLVALHLRPIALTKKEASDSAMRRLLFEVGDHLDDLMTLCEADITSKNEEKVNRFLKNFRIVKENIRLVEERDKIRNWQPPISGETIMKTFNLKPCREVGIIKDAIKDAILDGEIDNNYDAAHVFMLHKGNELGLNK